MLEIFDLEDKLNEVMKSENDRKINDLDSVLKSKRKDMDEFYLHIVEKCIDEIWTKWN
jgi:hypothetical protein